ncbi:MAG: SDR family NAD(P)-dependent oxidoreductase [Sulfurovum sp.]
MKKIWILGASSGIGFELLKLWLKLDYLIIASSSSIESNPEALELLNNNKTKLTLVDIDVTCIDSISKAFEENADFLSSIDTFFYNAGVYESTNSKNIQIHDFENMMNVNYLGFIRILSSALPYLEKDNYTKKIVVNGSLASYFGLPNAGAYGASKAALLSFVQSIQPELIMQNIQLQIINHGFVKTRLTAKNQFSMPQVMDSKIAAIIINKEVAGPYKFEIKFPFILSKFLQFLSLLPYRLSLAITKKML